eukprot:g15559.t1
MYVAKFQTNTIYKFTDNTTVVGWIANNDVSEYRKEIECSVIWRSENNLSLNFSKTKELIIDFRKKRGEQSSIYINRVEVERVESVKLLEVTITSNLSQTSHVKKVKKAQFLFFLRQSRKFGMSLRSLSSFYRCTIESILSECTTAWYGNCSAQDHKKLQKVV